MALHLLHEIRDHDRGRCVDVDVDELQSCLEAVISTIDTIGHLGDDGDVVLFSIKRYIEIQERALSD